MMLYSLFGVVRCVSEMPVRDVRMVPGLHMIAGFVMLRGFAVVPGCMLVMLGCLMMMRSALVICHGLWFSWSERNRTWIDRRVWPIRRQIFTGIPHPQRPVSGCTE
jgi:hypothetical protein